MISHTYLHDLIVLVADNDIEQTVRATLGRRRAAMQIRKIQVEYLRHPQRDNGCRLSSHDYLRLYEKTAQYSIVVFDYEGCGETKYSADELEQRVEGRLIANGWENRCGVIVIAPELERWIWTASEEIPGVLGYQCRYAELQKMLRDAGFQFDGDGKPVRPKEAMDMLLHKAREARSASIFEELATKVSLQRCTDRAFVKLKSKLQEWFPGD